MPKPLFIILSILLSSSCSGQAFQELENITSDNKLLIFPLRPLINKVGVDNTLIEKPILIEDSEVINKIIEEWGKNESPRAGFPIYKVVLIDDNKMIRSVSLNDNLSTIFTGHGYYEFDKNLLFKHEESFHPIDWVKLNFKTISNARTFINTLQDEHFIYYETVNPYGIRLDKEGTISLKTLNQPSLELEEYEKLLSKEFSQDISIKSSQQVGDSIILNILTEKTFSNNQPAKYKSITGWEPITDIEIDIVGCKEEDVIQLAEKLNMEL